MSYHFWSHKYHKIVNNFIFEQVKTIFLAKTLRIIVLLTQKFFIKLSKIWVWEPDPRSRIRISGSWIQGKKGIGSRIRNTENDRSSDRAGYTVLYNVQVLYRTALCNRFGTFFIKLICFGLLKKSLYKSCSMCSYLNTCSYVLGSYCSAHQNGRCGFYLT